MLRILRKAFKWLWGAIGVLSTIIGFAGLPDDLPRWAEWLEPIKLWAVSLAPEQILALGLALVAWVTLLPWRKLRVYFERYRKDDLNIIFRRPTEKQFPLASEEDLRSDTIKGKTVLVTHLPRYMAHIENRLFVDCLIVGPAVISSSETIIQKANFIVKSTIEEILWEKEGLSIGSIQFRNCIFRNCTFDGIGISGNKKFIRQFKKDVKDNSKSEDEKIATSPSKEIE